MQQIIRLTEGDLHRIVRQCVNEALNESDYHSIMKTQENNVNEGWLKNIAYGTAIAGASMLPHGANAQQTDSIAANSPRTTYNYRTPDYKRYHDLNRWSTKQDTIRNDNFFDEDDYVTNHPYTEQELAQMFPQAYKDRNAGPDVWKQNTHRYDDVINGKISIVGRLAASIGENPWKAILDKYSSRNYKNKIERDNKHDQDAKDIQSIFDNPEFDIK